MLSTADMGARFYLNGFPKSGLHLLELLVKPLAQPMYGDQFHAPWVNSHQGNAWMPDPYPLEQVAFGIGRTREGYYTKGHLGYTEDLDHFMYWSGLIHIFIYRDFRDVAVSQAHVLWYGGGEEGQSATDIEHPGRDIFRNMSGFNEVLSAVICGIDEYPGVMARWSQYAPWLQQDWVLCLRFEDIIRDRTRVAERILDHAVKRLGKILVIKPEISPAIKIELIKRMIVLSLQVKKSPTFRRGQPGEWSDRFTEEHMEQFRETDKDNWLIGLGFAEENWIYDACLQL